VKRGLTVVACGWAVLFVAIYIALTRRPPNDGPAWWYVGLVLVGVLVAASTLTGARPRLPLGIATGLFGIAILLGVLSIGLLLVPAAVLTAIGALTAPTRTDDTEPPGTTSDPGVD
jgi:hypothetical protein